MFSQTEDDDTKSSSGSPECKGESTQEDDSAESDPDMYWHFATDGITVLPCNCYTPEECAEALAQEIASDIILLRRLGFPDEERAAAALAAHPGDFRSACKAMLIGYTGPGLSANTSSNTAQ
jgi:hypothetical protein